MSRFLPCVVLLAVAASACKQIAGVSELVAPDGSSEAAVGSNDGGPGCTCTGCTTLATLDGAPQSLVVQGGYVYWLESGAGCNGGAYDGRLLGVPTMGGRQVELAAHLACPISITTDGNSLYWFETIAGRVDKLDLQGTTVTTIAAGVGFDSTTLTTPSIMNNAAGLYYPNTSVLVVVAGQTYFQNYTAHEGGLGLYAIARVATGGGPVQDLLGDLTAVDAGLGVPEADTLPGGGEQIDPLGFATGEGHLFWMNSNFGAGSPGLWKVSLSGGPPEVVAKGLSAPAGFVVAGGKVYVGDDTAHAVEAISTAGGSAETVSSDQALPWAMVADGTHVYWSNLGTRGDDGSVVKLAIGGSGSPTVLAAGLASPVAIAVDAQSVYWIDPVCDAVFKAPL